MHICRLCSCNATSSSNKENPEEKSKKHHQNVIQEKINGVSSESRIKMYGTDHRGLPIKGNLKKTLVQEDDNQISSGIRKVSWSDAHGKSIAHVQEFEPSVSDDGELKGVRGSSVCIIL